MIQKGVKEVSTVVRELTQQQCRTREEQTSGDGNSYHHRKPMEQETQYLTGCSSSSIPKDPKSKDSGIHPLHLTAVYAQYLCSTGELAAA